MLKYVLANATEHDLLGAAISDETQTKALAEQHSLFNWRSLRQSSRQSCWERDLLLPGVAAVNPKQRRHQTSD